MRVDLVNGIVAELAEVRDDVVLIDLATWVNGRVDDATLRPDGSHYEFEVDTGVAAELTGPPRAGPRLIRPAAGGRARCRGPAGP